MPIHMIITPNYKFVIYKIARKMWKFQVFSSHKMFITLTCTVHKTTMRCSKRFSTITNRKLKNSHMNWRHNMEKKNYDIKNKES